MLLLCHFIVFIKSPPSGHKNTVCVLFNIQRVILELFYFLLEVPNLKIHRDMKKTFWSIDGPVDIFLEPQKLKFSKSNKCQHADMDADVEVATSGVRCWMSGVDSRLTACQAWRKRGVEDGLATIGHLLEGEGATYATLEVIFKLNLLCHKIY